MTPAVYWRTAGTPEASGWNTTTGSTQGWTLAQELPEIGADTAVSVDTTFSAAAAAEQSRTPALLDVQVCFTYSATGATRCTWVSDDPAHASHVSVLRVPHAFGDSFPEAGAGPGTVALWTGEFSTAATDASIATPKDALSISRTYATFAGPTTTTAGVFGPGWVANLDGSAFGSAGLEVIDSTDVDGTIALVDGDGQALVYRQPGATATLRKTGAYTPVDEDTAATGARLDLAGTGASAELHLVEEDGTVTTWTLHGQGEDATWVVASVAQAGAVGTTTFTRDSAGRITRILAPAPDGVTCPADGALPAGCRAQRLVYATTTTATASTPGDYTGRLAGVFYDAHNPDKAGGAGMDSVQVAAYTYTQQGYLASAVDPRTGLGTTYTYTAPPSGLAAPQLATLTPAGLATWHLTYATTPQGSHGLARIARDPATGTGEAVVQAAFVYGINPATTTNDLPDLRSEAVAVWDQAAAPTWGAAVFGPDHPVTAVDASGVDAADWVHADLQYTDAQGRVVNTAAHGAGAWQISSTDYDTGGRVTRTLDARAIDQIRALHAAGAQVDPDSYATITRYNADITAPSEITHAGGTIPAGTVLTPAGTLVTDTWAPAAPAGTSGELVRVHTRTEYDQGAPNGGVNPATGVPYRLPTTVTTTAAAASAGSSDPGEPLPSGETVTSQDKTGYDPIDGSSPTGPTSGWTLAVATSSTTVMDGQPDITTRTAYNSAGQVTQTRQPESTGTDAGTTLTVHYTAGTNSADTACGNAPQYAGLVCAIKTGEATPTIATTRTTAYSMYGAPRVVTETLAGASRVTTTTYSVDGRLDTVTTATSGLAGSTPLPPTKTVYSATTGLPTATVSLTGDPQQPTIATGYDAWGRVTSYTDTDGQTTTTTYNTGGQVATTTDPTGTTTYTYDGTDAAGNAEHRGLVTAVSVTNADQGALAMAAAYDAAGAPTLQTLPGAIQHTTGYDRAGQLTDLAYTGNGVDGRFEWFAFTHTYDADGDITADTAPGRERIFTYDRARRLTHSTDTITTPDDPTECTTRSYGFDANGNRTTAATTTGQECTTTGATTRTWTHDSADRVLTGANNTGTYTYDALGRQTTLPAVDTPNGPGGGDLSIGYYDTDLARTLTQDDTTTTYQLDPAARRATSTTTDGTTTSTTVRHYGDTGDNPAWATTTTGGTTGTTRYVAAPASGLALQITGTNPAVTVADGHGSIATTIPIPTTGDATTTTGWHRTDEYGNTITTGAPNTGTLTYAWHGNEERANDPSALVLMGVRLYNPITGLFTSRDPIPGGNTTTYTYPQDPINTHDLDGKQRSWWQRNWKWVALGALVVGAAIGCAVFMAACFTILGLAARGGVYVARTAATGARYVGQSGNMTGRLSQHVASGKITRMQAATARVYRVNGGRVRREVAEQRIVNRHGGITHLANKRNPLGARRQPLLNTTARNWRGH